jgi:hypothetical protein
MTTEEISMYSEMVTRMCDSLDSLTEAVKDVRDQLHVLHETVKPVRHLSTLAESVEYMANHMHF